LAARLFHGFSLRSLLVSGALLQPVGAVLFVVLAPAMSPLVAAAGSLVMGFGMGLMSVSSLVLIQEIVEPAQRGSVTASNLFARNFGSTLGATLLGAVLNHGLRRAGMLQPITSDDLRRLLLAPSLAPDASHLRLAMEQALNLTFWAMMMLSLATVLLALRVPASALMHAPAKVVPEPAE
jgi:MFS family permease